MTTSDDDDDIIHHCHKIMYHAKLGVQSRNLDATATPVAT